MLITGCETDRYSSQSRGQIQVMFLFIKRNFTSSNHTVTDHTFNVPIPFFIGDIWTNVFWKDVSLLISYKV